jgi:hypothetical protein
MAATQAGQPRGLLAGYDQFSDWVEATMEVSSTLDEMRAPGSFAAFGVRSIRLLADTAQTAGRGTQPDHPRIGASSNLSVNGVGPIRYPLDEAQADAIIRKAHLSPHGQGVRTIVDRSVRNTWELNASQFTLSDDMTAGAINWTAVRSAAQQFVADGLGIARGADAVRVEPYKMLLYEPGAHFKPHTE